MKYTSTSLSIGLILLNGLFHNVFSEKSETLPWLIEGPISSNEIDHDLPFSALPEYDLNDELPANGQDSLETRPIIENVVIKSNITNRVDKTTVNFFVKNPSIRNTQEIAFSIELPHNEYRATNMSLQILGDERIYRDVNLGGDTKITYQKLLAKNQAGLMLYKLEKATPKSFNQAIMISLKAIIRPGDKQHITLQYEGPLVESGNGTWNHMVHINPHQLVQNFNVAIDLNDTLPITNIQAFEMRDGSPVFGYSESNMKCRNTSEECEVTFHPNEIKKEGNDGYDMNGQFHISFTRNKTLLLSKIGQEITNITLSPEFIQVFEVFEIIPAVIGLMFNMLLMVPFILFTEFVSAFNVIISEIMGFNTDWYTQEKRWYEKELEYEMNHLDRVFSSFDKKFENMDGEFNFHFETNEPLTLSDLKSDPLSKFHVFEDTFENLKQDHPVRKILDTKDKEDNKDENKEEKPSNLKTVEKNDFVSDFHDIDKFPKIINWKSSHSGSFSFHG
jgi:hypothetical protein